MSNNNYGFTDTAIAVLGERYFHDGEGLTDMFHRVADYVAHGDKSKAEEYYSVMLNRLFLPNSPTLMNAGRSGKQAQLSACYVLPVEDSMTGIFEALKNQALIHKYGGGTGFNFSRLRPKGSVVNSTNGVASGPVSFMELFDMATEKVMQGGMRRGANLGILNVEHKDIIDFIEAKLIDGKLSNFNISVGMSDDFMGRVINNRLSDKERFIWDTIIDCAWKTGDPGLIFLDTINRYNPAPEFGEIESANPCGESPLRPFEACNLGSVNLSNFVIEDSGNQGETGYFKNRALDFKSLDRVVRLAVDFLNDVIDVNHYPLPEIEAAVKQTRKIGLGVMGWADVLFKLGVRYGSDDSLKLAHDVMGVISEAGREQSDRRNAAVTCIAPTGTISIIAGCSSGIEPVFALEYDRVAFAKDEDSSGNSKKQVFHFIDDEYADALKNQDERLERGVFATAHDINYMEHIKMQAEFQKFVDLAVSKTVNMPNSATREDVERAYMEAWKMECRGITVYRDGCKAQQVLYRTADTADDAAQDEKCPECGSAAVIREGGCKRCTHCGWSPCAV